MTLVIRRIGDDRDPTEKRSLGLLDAHAEDLGLPFTVTHLAFEAWAGDTFFGGVTGRLVQDWLYVTLLAVDPAARDRGFGRSLIGTIEASARDRGAVGVWLDTFRSRRPASTSAWATRASPRCPTARRATRGSSIRNVSDGAGFEFSSKIRCQAKCRTSRG